MEKIYSILAIWDSKTECYGQPIVTPSILSTEREFDMMFKEKKGITRQFAEDFELVKVGEFNTYNGKVTTNFSKIRSGEESVKMWEKKEENEK